MVKNYTPNDLAAFVFKELERSKIKDKKPSRQLLEELFNTLYYTSLQTEEGQFIKVTITLIDHQSIEHDLAMPYDNWQFFPFHPPMEFNVQNLAKLSRAADPWSSSLAVYYNEAHELFIYGMIDQTVHYQNFLNYEREEKPMHAGIIQTMINGIGILNVMLDYQPLAALQQNVLVKHYPNVFEYGPVSDFIVQSSAYEQHALEKLIEMKLDETELEVYNDFIFEYIIQSISRILLKIKNYHHGGALLITKDFESDVTIKYALKYDRIQSAIMHILTSVEENVILNEKIKSLRKRDKEMPVELHDDCDASELNIKDGYSELSGAIGFVASLSCVDGLVLMSPQLTVKGFGTVITHKEQPPYIYVNKTAKPSAKPHKISPSHFGTRHQSMFAYCLKYPESLGFVVSQDGEIRAIKCIDGVVMMWENIKVYQFLKSNKLPKMMSTSA